MGKFGGLRVRIAWWIGYEGALVAKSVAQKKFKWCDNIYILRFIIFNLEHKIDSLHFISYREDLIPKRNRTRIQWNRESISWSRLNVIDLTVYNLTRHLKFKIMWVSTLLNPRNKISGTNITLTWDNFWNKLIFKKHLHH